MQVLTASQESRSIGQDGQLHRAIIEVTREVVPDLHRRTRVDAHKHALVAPPKHVACH